MLDDVLAMPDHLRDALWRVESARLEAGRLRRAPRLRDGRLGDRRRPRRGRARRAPRAAAGDGARLPAALLGGADWTVLCSSYSGETEETIACFEAATEAGARRIVASTGGAARRPGPRGGRPGRRPAGDPAAAGRGRLHGRRRGRGRRPGRGGAADRDRDRGRRRPARAARRGPRGPRSGDRRAPRRARLPVDLRRRADAPRGAALEDPGQREREAPAFFSELPEADHNEICGWAGLPEGASALGRHARGRRPASPPAPPLRADGGGDRRRRHRGGPGRDRGGDAHGAAASAR